MINQTQTIRANYLLVGPPGVGKTAKVKASYPFTHVELLSSYVREDAKGSIYRDPMDESLERRTVPAWYRELCAKAREVNPLGQRVCLLLDELDKADRDTANTLLSCLDSRAFFGERLPDNVDIVACANTTDAGGSDGISEPMISRFVVVPTQPDVATWARLSRQRYANVPQAAQIISLVETRAMPIYDTHGDLGQLTYRVTSPRTYWLYLDHLVPGAMPPWVKDLNSVANGLLTPRVASMISALTEPSFDNAFAAASKMGQKRGVILP